MTAFQVETRIPHPIADVYSAYRDQLPELGKFIPNVKTIEVVERKEEGGTVKLLNRWRAKAEVPGPLKSMITEDKLSWMDHATWDNDKRQCSWSLEITAFKDAVTCRGETRFHDEGAHTRMVISGDLQVDATRTGLPVPKLLAGSIGKAVETFAVALIKPNQEEVGRALTRYLGSRKG